LQDLETGEEILHAVIEPAQERTVASYDAIAFSTDGRYVAGASFLRMDIWDLTTKQIVMQFPLAISLPEIVLFSPDNSYVAASGFDGTQVWNLVDNKGVFLENSLPGIPQTLRFSADGQYLTGTKQERWEAGEDGAWYIGQNGTQVWNVATGSTILRLPEANTGSSFIGETHHLLTTNDLGAMQIWDVDTSTLLVHMLFDPQVATTIHPSGNYIAGVNELGQIRVWSPDPFLITQTLYPSEVIDRYRSTDNLNMLAYLPDGLRLVTVAWDGIVRFWDSENGEEQGSIMTRGIIRYIAAASDSTKLALGGGNHRGSAPDWPEVGWTTIHTISGTKVMTLTHEIYANDVFFSPDDRFVVTVAEQAQVWNAVTGEAYLTCESDQTPITALFSPDGNQLMVLTGDKVIVCDVVTGEIVQQFSSQTDSQFWQMATHPNGSVLAVATTNAVYIWDQASDSIVATLPVKNIDHRAKLIFTPDGRYLASMSHWTNSTSDPYGFLTIWESETWQPVMDSSERLLNDFAFSPDGDYMALANDEGDVWVVALADGREVNRLQERIPKVQIAFRPDGKQIALLGRWETVLLWQWNPEDWILEAYTRLNVNLP
ncbi:MAG: hypothetical protein KC443_24510, partial [Anaerolineales bacterium]|nr:hypothetical protein [Anaerolineales bacterium]